MSGKKLLSGLDSPYIQTEKSYLIALNNVNNVEITLPDALPLDVPFTLSKRTPFITQLLVKSPREDYEITIPHITTPTFMNHPPVTYPNYTLNYF